MKVISAALKAHIAQEVTSLCSCWELRRVDGAAMYFTDLDVPIVFGGQTYLPAVGYNKTAIQSSSDMSVDNFDIVGLLDDESITEADIRAGKYDYAETKVFLINWQDTSMGVIRLKRGKFGEVQILSNGTFKTEFRALGQGLLQTVGTPTSPECRNDLGDHKCKLNIDGPEWSRDGTVVTVASRKQFTFEVTDTLGEDPRSLEDPNWYRGGIITWKSGANMTRGIEMKVCSMSTHVIQLFLPVGLDIQPGDTFRMAPGCDKRRITCFEKFNNVVNMQAEPFKPGKDLLSQYPNMPYQS